MPVLFESLGGMVVQLDDPGVQCQASYALDPHIDFADHSSIVTRIVMSHQSNVQFLHTLGNLIYVYVFGDRMGQVSISGIAFACACDQEGKLPTSGPELIYGWYKANRVSRRAGPVQLTIGQTVIEGFVTGFSEDIADPATNLTAWSVNMAALPNDE